MLKTILKFDVENLNERIYTKECIYKVLPNVYKKIKKGYFVGTIGFPDILEPLSLKQISHKINNIYIEKDVLIADIELIDNVNGNIIQNNIDNFVFRLAGTGSVFNNYAHLVEIISICAITKEDDPYRGLLLEYPYYEKIFTKELLTEKTKVF